MKLSKIVLVGSGNITLNIDGALPSDNYIFKGADGLGPTEVDVSMSKGIIQGRRPRPRQMVFRIGVNPNHAANQSVSDLRDKVYGLLTSSLDGQILVSLYQESSPYCFTKGAVSKIEVVYFDEEPVVQVTVDCFDSYFTSVENVLIIGPSRFNFVANNIGTERTGFEFSIMFTAPTSQNFWKMSGGGRYMEFLYPFITGDVLSFGTDEDERYIYLDRSGTRTNLIESLAAGSDWLELKPGANSFTFTPLDFTILEFLYVPKYIGV